MKPLIIILPKSDALFKALMFVSHAVWRGDGDPPRFALDLIQVANEMANATDGHRLHQAHLGTRVPEGLYRCTRFCSGIKLEKVEDGRFPDINRVFWDTDQEGVITGSTREALIDSLRAWEEINPEWLNALDVMPGPWTFHFKNEEQMPINWPVLFFGQGFSAAMIATKETDHD